MRASSNVTLAHHGAVNGVIGACHQLSLHGPGRAKAGVLVDCGIFQGDEAGTLAIRQPRAGRLVIEATCGERTPIRAWGHLVGGYSAHAGHSDLLRFVTGMLTLPAEIRVVHADGEAKAALKCKLEAAGAGAVVVPGMEEFYGQQGPLARFQYNYQNRTRAVERQRGACVP